MTRMTTVAIWLRQQELLVLVDTGSLHVDPLSGPKGQHPGFRLVATQALGDTGAAWFGADSKRTDLVIWPPLRPQDVPMVLPSGSQGLAVRIYHQDAAEPGTFASAPEAMQCDATVALAEAERWWVLGCDELPLDLAEAERAFSGAALVESAAIETGDGPPLAQRIISAARGINPALRVVSAFLISPVSGERVGPALVERYRPRGVVVGVSLGMEPTQSGTLQPRLGVEAVGVALREVLPNLCIFQLRRHGPACALPDDLIFDCLGNEMQEAVGHDKISTNFFPPVHTGDVIGVVSRGVELRAKEGFKRGVADRREWDRPADVRVAMMVRHEHGFEPVEDDSVLLQTSRIDDMLRALAKHLCNQSEAHFARRIEAWVVGRLDYIGRDTLALIDDSGLIQRRGLVTEEHDKHLGNLLYPLAAPTELHARSMNDKPLSEPIDTLGGWPDSDDLARCGSVVPRSFHQP